MSWALLLLLPLGASTPELAAVVNGEPITLRAIDSASVSKIEQLRGQLAALAAEEVERLVDERIRTLLPEQSAPAPRPVSEAEVQAFRQERAQDFEGPSAPAGSARDPQLQGAAIRHYLEQQARREAEAQARVRRSEGVEIELLLPALELEAPLSPERPVARVRGGEIPASELERVAALGLYRLRGELYRERRRQLEAAIEQRLLEQEASRRGIPEAALRAQLEAPASVSDQEIRQYVEAERAAGRPAPEPERLVRYLIFRKTHARRARLLQQLRAAAHIEISLREPRAPRLPVEEGAAPALGAVQGPRLIAYTNLRCRACRITQREIDRLLERDRKLRVVFRDFIPIYDPGAREAARLTRCAAQQGAFGRLRRELLEADAPEFGRRWFPEETLQQLASRLGLDAGSFLECLGRAEISAAIERDTAHARSLGFSQAPAFVAEGVPLSGVQSAEGFERALRQARSR